MIQKTVDMPSPTGLIGNSKLAKTQTPRRPVGILIAKKEDGCQLSKDVMFSVRLAILFLGSLAIYDQGLTFIHGGNMEDQYVRYAQVVIFFALLGLAFFCYMVLDIILGLVRRFLCPKKV